MDDEHKFRNISSYFYLVTHCYLLWYFDHINKFRVYLRQRNKEAYKPGHDIIKLVFDFENDKIEVYINKSYIDTLPLNKSILFGGSFYNNGTSIEIKECNFYNN